jgi:peptidoglycan/LPS O-acetylase OafA/YrhL
MMPLQFNKNVHGCRGLFAFMVFLFHVENSGLSSRYFWNNDLVLNFSTSGAFGVELFFCISGYVIVMSMLRTPTAGEFIMDRLLRIMPALLAIQILLFGIGTISHDRQFADISFWQWIWLFISNALLLPGVFPFPAVNVVAWTLSFEMVFYLMACFFYFYAIPRIKQQWLTNALIVVTAIGFFVQFPRATFFTVGIFALLFDDQIRQFFAKQRWYLSPVPYLLVFLVLWRQVWPVIEFRHTIYDMTLVPWLADHRWFTGSLAYLCGMIFFFSALHDNGWFGRMMRTPALQYMGTISYSFYLWHAVAVYGSKMLLMAAVLPRVGDEWGTTLLLMVALPAALGGAHLCYVVVERWFTKLLRDKLYGRRIYAITRSA